MAKESKAPVKSKKNDPESGHTARRSEPLQTHGEDPVMGLDSALSWMNIWIMSVARAWRDEGFKKKLLSNNPQVVRALLLEHFGYKLPSGMNLQVRELTAEEKKQGYGWDPERAKEKKNEWELPPTLVNMVLPPPPEELVDNAVALSDYVDSGRTYPFSTF